MTNSKTRLTVGKAAIAHVPVLDMRNVTMGALKKAHQLPHSKRTDALTLHLTQMYGSTLEIHELDTNTGTFTMRSFDPRMTTRLVKLGAAIVPHTSHPVVIASMN